MSQQAIVKIGYRKVLAPSIKAGSDLLALLGRCQEIEESFPHIEDYSLSEEERYRKGYTVKPLELSMEVVNLTPAKEPKPAARTDIHRRAGKSTRQLPPARPAVLQLPFTIDP